jgi:mRNA-decapping enzyme subunit 2
MNNDEPKHLCAIREVRSRLFSPTLSPFHTAQRWSWLRTARCALQVEEETGYNCASLLNEHDYIQITMNDQEITLFVVTGVPEETAFSPQTRKEISVRWWGFAGVMRVSQVGCWLLVVGGKAIEWFRLGELPTWSRKRMDQRPAKFFMIAPFVVYVLVP